MLRGLHDVAGGRDRMDDTLHGCHGPGTQAIAFHDGGIHPSDFVQLTICALAGIKEPAALENPNRLFNSDESGCASIQEMIADLQSGSKTGRLWRRHGPGAGTPVRENHRAVGLQFKSTSLVLR